MAEQPSNEDKKEKAIEKAISRIEAERNEMDEVQRFGYFSIPYPATVGDGAYSKAKVYSRKIVDGKVVTEKRGIFTQPMKKGKTNDAYFKAVEPLPDSVIEEHKQLNKNEKEALVNRIKFQKENKVTVPQFKPPGAQKLKGFYESEEKYEPTGPLTREPKKLKRVSSEGKVITEKRGIFTNPPHFGASYAPHNFFSYPTIDDPLLNEIKQRLQDEVTKQNEKLKEKKEKKGDFRKPFFPASLKKCECFSSIEATYRNYDDATTQKILEEYLDLKKKGNSKYAKVRPPGSVEHNRPFAPPRLVSMGRTGLFNDDLYKIPRPEKTEEKPGEKMSIRQIREQEKANSKKPFYYNKIMGSSTFAPSISMMHRNLKRDFSCIYKY